MHDTQVIISVKSPLKVSSVSATTLQNAMTLQSLIHFSATTDKRPAFQKMIKDSAKNMFDVIIVQKLDRFARNRYDSARYKAQLRKNGVKVISANENISEGSEGIILESVLESMAEYYSAPFGKGDSWINRKCYEMQV